MGKHAFDSRGQSANLFVRMVEGLDEGLLFLDRDLRITYANPAASSLLWTPEKGLRGKPLAEALPDTLGRTILEKAVTALNTGSAVTFEDLLFTPMLSCRILPSEDGIMVVLQDISVNKDAEERLKLSELKFQAAFHSSPDLMAISDPVTRAILDVNASFLSCTGFSREELIGKNSIDLGLWTDPSDHLQKFERLMAGEPVDGLGHTLRRKDGELRDMLFWVRLLDVGRTKYLFTMAKDVTEERRAARRILEDEEKLRALSDNLPSLAIFRIRFDMDAPPRIEYMSAGIERLAGITPLQAMKDAGAVYRRIVHDDLMGVMAAEAHAYSTLSPFECEARMKHASTGEIRWVLLRSSPSVQEKGSTVWSGIILDISAQKHAEQALRESEATHRFLTEKMSDEVWTCGMDMKATYISPSVEKLLGYTPEERLGKDARDIMTPESYQAAMECFMGELERDRLEGMDPDRTATLELEYYHKNGSRVWMENVYSAIRNESGEVTGLHAVCRDITEKKTAAELLRLSEQKFEAAFQSSPDPMAITELETGRIVDANSSFMAQTGYSTAEVIGKDLQTLGLWVVPGDRLRVTESLRAGKPVDMIEIKLSRKDKAFRDMLFSARLMDIGGKTYMFTLAHDVTEEKAAAKKLMESEALLRSVSDNLHQVAVYRLRHDTQPCFEYVSAGIERLAGVSPEDALLDIQRLYDLILPEDLDKLLEAERHAYRDLTPFACEFRITHAATGEIRWVLMRSTPMRMDDGYTVWNGIIHDISSQKQAEQALRESEAKYRFLTERMSDVVWTCDKDLTVTYVSPSLEKVVGYAPEEWTGLNLKDFVTPVSFGQTLSLYFEELERDGLEGVDPDRTIVHEMEFLHKNGSPVWVESHSSLIHDPSGMVVGAYGVTRDITDRRKAEQTLRESEAKFRFISENMSDIIWIADMNSRFTYISPSIEYVSGYAPEEYLALTIEDAVSSGSYTHMLEAYAQSLEREVCEGVDPNRFINLEIEMLHKNGSTIWVEIRARFIRDGSGSIIGVLGVSRDITERKKAEQALMESEERLRHAQMAGKVGIFDWNLAAGTFVMIDSSKTIIEDNYREDAPESWSRMIHPEDLPMMRKRLGEAIGKKASEVTIEHRLAPAGDVPRWFSTRAFISYDESGRDTRIAGTTMDVTALKQAREDLLKANEHLERKVSERTFLLQEMNRSLLEQKEVLEDVIRMRERMDRDIRRLATAVDHTQDSIMLISPDGVIEYANPATEHISGFERHELIGKNMADFGAYYQDENLPSHVSDVISQGKGWTGRSTRKKSNGDEVVVDLSAAPVFDQSGNLINYVTVSRDVTHELELRDQITQVQKMNAVSAMAGGIAYDLRNTFMPILANTRILLEHLREDDPAHFFVGKVLQETHSGLDLVDQLLTLRHSDIQEKKPVPLQDVVREAVHMLKATLPSSIVIRPDLGGHEDTVLADPVQIKQVLIHLADNACKAMKGKRGLLSIRLGRKELGAREARRISPALTPGTYAQIRVRDTGEGMDEDTKRMIIESFFSPLRNGKGKSMGLTVVLGIVTSHQGALTVSSRPGKGAAFTVYLPVMSAGNNEGPLTGA